MRNVLAYRYRADDPGKKDGKKSFQVDGEDLSSADVYFFAISFNSPDDLLGTPGGGSAFVLCSIHFVQGRTVGGQRCQGQVGADEAGADHGDANIVLVVLRPQRVGETMQRVFRCRITGPVGGSELAGKARDVDEVPLPASDKMRKQIFREGHGAKIIDLHKSSVNGDGGVGCQASLADAPVVDEDVNTSEDLYSGIH